MTDQTARTPYCRKIRYGITGAPTLTEDEMDGSHAPGIGVAPALIELVYSAARDGKPASVTASVTGCWTRFGERADGQVTVHFKNGPDGWPAWLAKEARLHDPAAERCICGHTEAQHFEDVCLVCDCGDYLVPEAAREVIARLQEAVKREAPDQAAEFTAADLVAALRGAGAERDKIEAKARATTDAEDPARIDRLRPEFFEHASVEAIDSQIRRAQTQQRQWGNRARTLAILRKARVKQKELGEWPAAVQQPKEA